MITVIHTAFNDKFKPVANVHTTDLETAYRLTNSVESAWVDNDVDVFDVASKGCRSTSVGDVMVHNGKVFQVTNFGFEEVTTSVVTVLVVDGDDWEKAYIPTQDFTNTPVSAEPESCQ